MADIVLADCGGQGWLVLGEPHIDDLLANTLPAHVSIEVVTCESKVDVQALWVQHGGDPDDMQSMWLIHPAILKRARGQGQDLTIRFAAWSASLDDAALETSQAIADAAAQQAEAKLVLTRYIAADGPPLALELANLRTGLLEARLAMLGVAADRVVREIHAPNLPEQTDQIGCELRLA